MFIFILYLQIKCLFIKNDPEEFDVQNKTTKKMFFIAADIRGATKSSLFSPRPVSEHYIPLVYSEVNPTACHEIKNKLKLNPTSSSSPSVRVSAAAPTHDIRLPPPRVKFF